MKQTTDLPFLILVVASFAGIAYFGWQEMAKQNHLIETGFCTMVFLEDDGDENYKCQDGSTFEREAD